VEGQSNGDDAPASIGTVELKAMVVVVESLEALLHVGEPNAAALRERVGIWRAGAIVGHAQVQAVVYAARFDGEMAARLARHDGVAYGVFHERL
jgi:predicted secreted protein